MSNNSEWVSLRHAADILGVHPATVRNWADKGELPARRTPGGHRRFRMADLQRMASNRHNDDDEDNGGEEVQLILQNALGQTRMQLDRDNMEAQPWYSAMSEETKQVMREQGRKALKLIRQYAERGESGPNLAGAVKLGKVYAAHLHKDGLTLPQAMRGFFYFSHFIMESILDLSALRDKNEWASLIRQVNDFNNAMLLSIVEYYEDD